MIVKELIEKLKQFDENLEVVVDACYLADDICRFTVEDNGIYVHDFRDQLIITHFG